MRIEKSGAITTLDDWHRLAPPRLPHQWAKGRSAFEVANAWVGSGTPSVPADFSAFLDSRAETQGMVIERVFPERRLPFDTYGEPSNADLAMLGHTATTSRVVVIVEAKSDEPFGSTVTRKRAAAIKYRLSNPRSNQIARIEGLVPALFHSSSDYRLPKVDDLRYQLLTGVAGTLAYAAAEGATTAVFVVHEFVTNMTTDRKHRENAQDYWTFLRRLSGKQALDANDGPLFGPFTVPGAPRFTRPAPLFIGKLVTNLR